MRTTILLLSLSLLLACENLLVNQEPANDQMSNFDILWEDFDRNYTGFIARGIDWDLIQAESRSKIAAGLSDTEFLDLIKDIILGFEDIHVELRTPTEAFRHNSTNPNSSPGLPTIDFYFQNIVRVNPILSYGNILAENIGYIRITSFSANFPLASFEAIDPIIEDLADTDGLIIDIRSNGGGAYSNLRLITSRFIATTAQLQSQTRNGPNHDDFSEPLVDIIEPEGARQYTKPIVVLTNSNTASAAESFAMIFRDQPHATLVGDTTARGFGNSIWRELPNGWAYRMTISLISDRNGISYEGIGIAPDQLILITRQDSLNGIDPQLETAIALLR